MLYYIISYYIKLYHIILLYHILLCHIISYYYIILIGMWTAVRPATWFNRKRVSVFCLYSCFC